MNLAQANPLRWPIGIKLPMVAAFFLIAVSAVITNAVLARLAETQERHLRTLTSVYLDGLSSAILPHVLRDDTWEVFDALERSLQFATGFGQVQVIVVNAAGEVMASSDPRKLLVNAALPEDVRLAFAEGANLTVNAASARADAKRPLVYQGRAIGTIFARVDISSLLLERRDVLMTLVATNGLIAAVLAAIAYFAVRRMMAPVRILSRHLDYGILGDVQSIDERVIESQNIEFQRVFRRFNAMAGAVAERETLASQLAAEERVASLGRLASGMAHEINNPLGGLFNALSTLRRHGDTPAARDRALNLLQRGLAHIRDVVRAALVTYRSDAVERELNPADVEDLRLLVGPEADRKSIELVWHNEIDRPMPVAAGIVRQATLNLLLNACAATPLSGKVQLLANRTHESLSMTVTDEGPGLSPEHIDFLGRPAGQHQPADGRLGLWMIRNLMAEAGGHAEARCLETGGTVIRLTFPFAESLARVEKGAHSVTKFQEDDGEETNCAEHAGIDRRSGG